MVSEKTLLPDIATTIVASARETTNACSRVLAILPFTKLYKNMGNVMIHMIAVDNRERNSNMTKGCCKQTGVPGIIGIGRKNLQRKMEVPNIIIV